MTGEDGYTLVVGHSTPLTGRVVGELLAQGQRVAFVQAQQEHEAPASTWQRFVDLEAAQRLGSLWLLAGDPVAIDFGLSGAVYGELCSCVRRAVFCVQPRAYPADAEQSDVVRAADELVELVDAGGAAGGVVYLSSLLVFGDRRGSVSERDFRVGQAFNGPYEESLAVAEKVIRRIEGLEGRCPLTVMRAAPACGAYEPPDVDPLGPLGEIARAVQLAPAVEAPLTQLPLRLEIEDRIAKALTKLTEPVESGTIHLVDRNAPTVGKVVTILARHFEKRIEEVPRPRPLLKRTKNPAARLMTGWNLDFERMEAERRLLPLLDPDWKDILELWYPPAQSDAASEAIADPSDEPASP